MKKLSKFLEFWMHPYLRSALVFCLIGGLIGLLFKFYVMGLVLCSLSFIWVLVYTVCHEILLYLMRK